MTQPRAHPISDKKTLVMDSDTRWPNLHVLVHMNQEGVGKNNKELIDALHGVHPKGGIRVLEKGDELRNHFRKILCGVLVIVHVHLRGRILTDHQQSGEGSVNPMFVSTSKHLKQRRNKISLSH